MLSTKKDLNKRDRRIEFRRENMRILTREMGGRFKYNKSLNFVMFREKGMPKVNFYPQYGTFKIVDNPEPNPYICDEKTGKPLLGAVAFLIWYRALEKKANEYSDCQ